MTLWRVAIESPLNGAEYRRALCKPLRGSLSVATPSNSNQPTHTKGLEKCSRQSQLQRSLFPPAFTRTAPTFTAHPRTHPHVFNLTRIRAYGCRNTALAGIARSAGHLTIATLTRLPVSLQLSTAHAPTVYRYGLRAMACSTAIKTATGTYPVPSASIASLSSTHTTG